MNYLLIANPENWKSYHPIDFDKSKKITYEINGNNKRYFENVCLGEKALLLITGKYRVIKYEAVVSSLPMYVDKEKVVEFTFNKTVKEINIDILKFYPDLSRVIFTISNNLHQTSVLGIDEDLYNRIVNVNSSNLIKYLGNEDSRTFFLESEIEFIKYSGNLLKSIDGVPNYIKSSPNIISDLRMVKDIKQDKEFLKILKANRILQIRSFKDNENAIDEIKEILYKNKKEPFPLEGIEIEAIAYYKSYHDCNFKYGIYFNITALARYILSTEEYLNGVNKSSYNFKTIRDICVEKVLQHERFHYLTELFITFEELASKNLELYKKYRHVYQNTFRTNNCLAEALANYFSKMYFIKNGMKSQEDNLNQMFKAQAPGYSLAASIDESNEVDMFRKFEEQLGLYTSGNSNIGKNNSNYKQGFYSSVMYKEVRQYYLGNKLPLAQLEINNKLNIPIYIVNDGLSDDDFYKLVGILFPKFNK